MRSRRVFIVLLTLWTATESRGGAELVLIDGRRIAGETLERRGGDFLLEGDQGVKLVVPYPLIAEIRLTGESAARSEVRRNPAAARALTEDLRDGEPIPFAVKENPGQAVDETARPARGASDGSEIPGSGGTLDEGSAHAVSDWPILRRSPPSQAKQLAAFGRGPAGFRPGPVDPTWRYKDVLGYESDVTQFRPSRSNESLVNPTWRYEDVLGYESDVTRFDPAHWHRPPIRAWWYPTDGWPPYTIDTPRNWAPSRRRGPGSHQSHDTEKP